MLEIRLLGPLEVRVDGRVVDLRRRKQRALLAALALRAGDVVSPDRLVDDLWGEQAPKTARHALENYVSDLRKALGRDAIRTSPAGYSLDVVPERVDVMELERLLSEAGRGTAEERTELYDRALSLVRGEPLEDLAYEPFAQAAVPRLQELTLVAREGHADAELELGRHAEAVVELEPLVAAFPYRERLRAQLMLALYRSGRQADALAAYQDGRRILVEELGIDPSIDLQELERAILRQDPSLSPPVRVPAAPRTPSSDAGAGGRPARKVVSVLVAELANAASLASALDPEQLRAVLDRYHAAGEAAIQRHGGVGRRLDVGTILAVFGAPTTHEDDALRAVRAAVDLRDGVGELNDGLFSESGMFLEIREAVTSGEALVTPQEAELVTGRPVTEARELVRGARGGQILVAESACSLLRGVVEMEPLRDGEGSGASRLVELSPDVHGRLLRLDSPLVGRRRQLARLADVFELAVADRALHLMTLVGEAGVGKSRLVREFTESIASVAAVRRCNCLPYGEQVAYRPVAEALGIDGGAGGPSPSSAEVRAALELLALDRPLVLVVDDLQWAEQPLLELIAEIADLSRGAPVLVLCIARPDLLETVPSWGGGKPNATSLLLEPLTEPESDRLIDNLLGESDLPDSLRDHVIRVADGNPLFVEELLAALVDQKVLTRQAGRWTTTTAAAVPVPATIQALITSRIDGLPAGERVVLELASLEPTPTFSQARIAEIASDDIREAVPAHLAGLVRKELVRPKPGDADRFGFRHELVRDAAYSSMPMAVRADLHERLAELVEGSAHEDGEDLAAHHLDRARHFRDLLEGRSPDGSARSDDRGATRLSAP